MDQNPAVPSVPPLPLAEYKDRHTGLMVFGILEILLGALCVLLTGFIALGQVMVSQRQEAALSARLMIPAMLGYLVLATVFVWLGIGSIQCRRWARALVLILAWFWLCVGVITVPLMAFMMPRILAASPTNGQAMPHGLIVVVVIIQLLFMALFMIIVPGVLVFFYQSRHVKATCEARDPVRRWTDACALPVLAVACLLWLGSATMLVFPLAYGGVVPVFGGIVSGLPGIVLTLCLAGFWFWLAHQWYRVKVAGWWALLATLIVFGVSNLITFSHVDIMDLYQRMGYPEAQLELIRRQGLASSQIMLSTSMAGLIPMLGYLVWIKSFFHNPKPQSESPS